MLKHILLLRRMTFSLRGRQFFLLNSVLLILMNEGSCPFFSKKSDLSLYRVRKVQNSFCTVLICCAYYENAWTESKCIRRWRVMRLSAFPFSLSFSSFLPFSSPLLLLYLILFLFLFPLLLFLLFSLTLFSPHFSHLLLI